MDSYTAKLFDEILRELRAIRRNTEVRPMRIKKKVIDWVTAPRRKPAKRKKLPTGLEFTGPAIAGLAILVVVLVNLVGCAGIEQFSREGDSPYSAFRPAAAGQSAFVKMTKTPRTIPQLWALLSKRLARIETKIERKLSIMAGELDTLITKVQETADVEDSAIALLGGLSAQIAALKNDPVKLQALSDQLNAKKEALAAAVIANTPAANP